MEANRSFKILSGTSSATSAAVVERPETFVGQLRKRFALAATAAVVFEAMWRSVGRLESGGRSFRAVDLAAELGCDPKSVTGAWKKLAALGLLTLVTKGNRGAATVYAVHDPERVYASRVVAAPAVEQMSLAFDADEEPNELPGELPGKIPGIFDEATCEATQPRAEADLPGNLPGNFPGKRALHDHEMNLLKISSHDGAVARCTAPSRPEPPRAPSRTAESSEDAERSLVLELKRIQRERRAVPAPLSTVGSLLARHVGPAARGRDSPDEGEPLGVGPDEIANLAERLQVRCGDPAAEWKLFVDLARDVVEKRLPWETVKGWFDRMDRAGDKVGSRGAVLRSNYKRYGRR